ncbi:hypothetical protein QE152_g29984 [Popillia japonica]|uniref:Uncharacterized protein n=1 Tax=Popillia japonica TaxID=7064 RepID=A0AAW1JG59_POPJA
MEELEAYENGAFARPVPVLPVAAPKPKPPKRLTLRIRRLRPVPVLPVAAPKPKPPKRLTLRIRRLRLLSAVRFAEGEYFVLCGRVVR